MKKKYTKADVWSAIKNILLVIAGTLVLSFGTSLCLLQFDLVAGGISGISIVIDHIISEYLPVLSFITLDITSRAV